jgi:hypothetical protein
VLGALAGGHETVLSISGALCITIIGGVLIGGTVAYLFMVLTGRTPDYLVEITFTTLAAYGSFFLAERFHCSGVLAALTAGLVVGNFRSSGSISADGRHALGPFWEYLAFVANSLIFLLIGAQEAQQHFEGLWAPVFAAIVLVTLGRAVAIYPLCALFARSRLKVDLRYQHVLFWGGLRGALALALALSLPDDLPHQNAIVAITFAVVAFPYSRKDSPSPRSCANWARSVGLHDVRWGNGVAKADKLANHRDNARIKDTNVRKPSPEQLSARLPGRQWCRDTRFLRFRSALWGKDLVAPALCLSIGGASYGPRGGL